MLLVNCSQPFYSQFKAHAPKSKLMPLSVCRWLWTTDNLNGQSKDQKLLNGYFNSDYVIESWFKDLVQMSEIRMLDDLRFPNIKEKEVLSQPTKDMSFVVGFDFSSMQETKMTVHGAQITTMSPAEFNLVSTQIASDLYLKDVVKDDNFENHHRTMVFNPSDYNKLIYNGMVAGTYDYVTFPFMLTVTEDLFYNSDGMVYNYDFMPDHYFELFFDRAKSSK